jgi:hypothetical protein
VTGNEQQEQEMKYTEQQEQGAVTEGTGARRKKERRMK